MRALIPLAFLLLPASAHAFVWPDVPERLERGLASTDPASRRAAAKELASLGPARGAPLVMKALVDQDTEVRLAAAHSAIRLRVTSATEIAMVWLGEREARLRIAACEVANAMPTPRAVQAVARSLGDSDPLVRTACADALGASGAPEAVAPLAGKLDDPTPNVRAQVARALARLGDPKAVVPLVGKVQDQVPDVRQAVVHALGELGDPRASQALLLALRDNVPEVKIGALAALGRLRSAEAVDPIAPLVLDRAPGVRQAAFVALGRIGTPQAVRALIRALGTQDDATGTLERTPVRDALVSAGAPAVAELTALLDRPISAQVAVSAAAVLGELRATSSAPALVAALRKGTLAPAAALRALAGAGTPDQVPVVLEFVADPSQSTRDEALRAASALLDPARPDGRAVEPLAATLKSVRSTREERAAVAMLLGRTGAPRAALELAPLAGAKDTVLRLAAIDALGALGAPSDMVDDALFPLLSDESAVVRLHVAVALGASGGAKAKKALALKLEGGEEVDRFAVLAALGGILDRFPDEAMALRLFSELGVAAGPERDAVFEAAGRNRSSGVVGALARAAKTADADDRRAIAAVIGAHGGSREAIGLARALAGDSDASVRAQAAWSLGALGDTSLLPELARAADVDVATNAAGALARARAPAAVVCPLLADPRPHVRANALAALAASASRCEGGRVERKLLVEDTSDLVRLGAARAVSGASSPEDRVALDKCTAGDRSAEVARACRGTRGAPSAQKKPRAVTIFVVGESRTTARPYAPFLLEFEGGVLRAGAADRRGAVFDPAAPAGDVVLRRR